MDTLSLTKALIERPSITPDDSGCQDIIKNFLGEAGFTLTDCPKGDVHNLWACHGDDGPVMCFAGHTDIVATGNLSEWTHPPFKAVVENDILHGRGSQDMKGALAAMCVAAHDFVKANPNHPGRIALLITSAEEGSHYRDGTPYVLEQLKKMNTQIDWCIVGEPSCHKVIGDTLRNGRRGSLKCYFTANGKQGHVAYPHLAVNPIHQLIPVLNELISIKWDDGNAYFPPTTMQCAVLQSSTTAMNVIPGSVELGISFRYSSELTFDDIRTRFKTLIDQHDIDCDYRWEHSGQPFLTENDIILDVTAAAIEQVCGIQPELSTAGGTSDGRFIAPTGAKVIELGTTNDRIHKINERVAVDELEKLYKIYHEVLEKMTIHM